MKTCTCPLFALIASLGVMYSLSLGLRHQSDALWQPKAVALAESLKPDVMTMDINMPHMDGLQATEVIMSTKPRPTGSVTCTTSRSTTARPVTKSRLTGSLTSAFITVGTDPQRATGRLPVVVLLHGSGGLNGGNEFWAKHLGR